MIIRGKAIKYGDDVNTDLIIAGKYLSLNEPEDLAKHAMENLDSDFFTKFTKGDIIVAGKNFGCGSSREQAVLCLKHARVGTIIAKSFARIFYRNAINQGIPIIESTEAVDGIESGDALEIDIEKGLIINKTKNRRFTYHPIPEFLKNIVDSGGLVPWIKNQVK